MKNIRRAFVTLGLGAGLLATTAFGGTITQTFTVPLSATDITASAPTPDSEWSFDGFINAAAAQSINISGQVLTAVTFQFSGFVNTSQFDITNPATGTPQTFFGGQQTQVELDTGILDTSIVQSDLNGLSQAALGVNGSFGGVSDANFGANQSLASFGTSGHQQAIAVNSTITYCPTVTYGTGDSHTAGVVVSAPCIYSWNGSFGSGSVGSYSGSGVFDLGYDTNTVESSGGGLSNLTQSIATSTSAFYSVIYTYGPSGAPEPTTMLLFGSSLVGLGLLRRRAQKR